MTRITAVINLHREGELAVPSLESLVNATREAMDAGMSCEVLAVLDRSDAATSEVVARYAERVTLRVEATDFGELAAARNHAVGRAEGEFIGFLDADDLWCRSWLVAAGRAAEREPSAIFHPALNVIFGSRRLLMVHPDMGDRHVAIDSLRSVNYWTSLSFASREIYGRFPYRPNRLDQGFGFEDWAWNCETIAAGLKHRAVPETTHFIRSKPADSLREQTVARGCLRSKTDLFVWPSEERSVDAAEL